MYTRRLDMIGANIDWLTQSAPCDWSKMITWSLWREPETPGHLCVWLGLAWSFGIGKVSLNWPSKMRNGIVHHKSDRKSCVIPTADRNSKVLAYRIPWPMYYFIVISKLKIMPFQIILNNFLDRILGGNNYHQSFCSETIKLYLKGSCLISTW